MWTRKADFPGEARILAVGFSIGTKGFIGVGSGKNGAGATALSDFWQWDQITNTWSQKPDYGGGPARAAVGFSIGDKGYIGTGSVNGDKSNPNSQFWEYSDTTNCTITVTAFSDPSTICVGSSVGIFASGGTTYSWNTGSTDAHITTAPTVTTTYLVTGTNAAGCSGVANITITVYDCATAVAESGSVSSIAVVFPNPFSESAVVTLSGEEGTQQHEMKIFDLLGNEVRSINFTGKQTTIERGNLSEGVYFYKIQTPLSLKREDTGKFIINK